MAFKNIQADEMRQFLRADKGWTEFDGPSREYVYVSPIKFMPNNAVLKVYTGINKENNNSRKKGDDAIRVCVVEDGGHGRGVAKTAHVKRVDGWKANLVARIVEVLGEMKRRKPASVVKVEPQKSPEPKPKARIRKSGYGGRYRRDPRNIQPPEDWSNA